MDLIIETAGLMRELNRMKAKDRAKPRVENHPVSGSYMIPTMTANQSILVTVTSTRPDWPFFSAKAYDTVASEYINDPTSYKQTNEGVSTTTLFWIPLGAVVGNQIRLEWTVIAQSPSTVELKVA